MKYFFEILLIVEWVVDVVEGLVQQYGYNGFLYDDVVQLVGIKKLSIYYYFFKKGEFVVVVVQCYMYWFCEELLSIEGQYVKVFDRLIVYVVFFECIFVKDWCFCVCGMLGVELDLLLDVVVSEVE